MHIARLAAFAPGCHPVAVGPGALRLCLTFFICQTVRSSSLAWSLRASARAFSASPCSLSASLRTAGARAAFCRTRESRASSWASFWGAWRRSPEGVRCMGFSSMAFYLRLCRMS
jgi:hypothetical protein